MDRTHDVDRARAIAALRRSGAVIRRIASALGFSEATLRHLLWTLNASAEDQDLARRNQISTNELVRRAKHAKRRQELEREESAQRAQEHRIRDAAASICDWLTATKFAGPTCELIVEEARREFAERERIGNLPQHPIHPLPTLDALIDRCKPTTPDPGGAASVTWHAQWLVRWSFFAFPDPYVRDSALQIAAEKQWTR